MFWCLVCLLLCATCHSLLSLASGLGLWPFFVLLVMCVYVYTGVRACTIWCLQGFEHGVAMLILSPWCMCECCAVSHSVCQCESLLLVWVSYVDLQAAGCLKQLLSRDTAASSLRILAFCWGYTWLWRGCTAWAACASTPAAHLLSGSCST